MSEGSPSSRRFIAIGIVCYLIMIAGIVFGLWRARDTSLHSTELSQDLQNWQEWREDVARRSQEPGPVQRKVPKSTEPPGLVLLRDHFAACLAMLLIISTALFTVFAFLLHGALRSTPMPDERASAARQ